VGQDNRASQITENSAHYLLELILPGIREGWYFHENQKKQMHCNNFLIIAFDIAAASSRAGIRFELEMGPAFRSADVLAAHQWRQILRK
jgi:hypothetical protein